MRGAALILHADRLKVPLHDEMDGFRGNVLCSSISSGLGEYADEDGTMYVVSKTEDNYFDEFEEELDKVEDYINTMEGPKQAALDVLALIRVITDEVQSAIYSQIPGKSAEAVNTKTFQLGNYDSGLEPPEGEIVGMWQGIIGYKLEDISTNTIDPKKCNHKKVLLISGNSA